MAKDRTPPYEKPVVIPLGELARGSGASCSPGSNPGTGSPSDGCDTGGTAGGNCKEGSNANNPCIPGGVAASNCNSGGTQN